MAGTVAQRKWIQMIHIAKQKTGVGDEAYRAILNGCAQVETSSEIQTWEQYNSVMATFSKLGFKTEYKKPVVDTEPKHPDWLTQKQEYYIKGLWNLVATNKEEKSLDNFVSRITGTSHIAWLKKKDATKVIQALRKMAAEKGINPDTNDRSNANAAYCL